MENDINDNLDPERAILGALFHYPERFGEVPSWLTPRDFARVEHRRIFQAMIELYHRDGTFDLITLTYYLREEGKLDGVKGASYLSELDYPTTSQIKAHALIVKQEALKRKKARLIRQLHDLNQDGSDPDTEKALIDQLHRIENQADFTQASRPTANLQIHWLDQPSLEREVTVWDVRNYVRPHDSVLISAPPGEGKTTLALALTLSIVTGNPFAGLLETKKGKVLYLDFENRTAFFDYAKGLGLLGNADIGVFQQPIDLYDPKVLKRLIQTIKDKGITSVFIDSTRKVLQGDGKDEKDVNAFFRVVVEPLRSYCTVYLIHHDNKAADLEGRPVSYIHSVHGSGAWASNATCVLGLGRRSGYRILSPRKVRTFGELPSISLNLLEGDTGVRLHGTYVDESNLETPPDQRAEEQALQFIVAYLKEHGTAKRSALVEAGKTAGHSETAMDRALTLGLNRGDLEKPGYGVYALKTTSSSPPIHPDKDEEVPESSAEAPGTTLSSPEHIGDKLDKVPLESGEVLEPDLEVFADGSQIHGPSASKAQDKQWTEDL